MNAISPDAAEPAEGPSIDEILAELPPEKAAVLRRYLTREVDPLGLDVEDGGVRSLAEREAEAAGALNQLQRLRARLRDQLANEAAGAPTAGPTSEMLGREMLGVQRRYESARKNIRRARDREAQQLILDAAAADYNAASMREADPRASHLALLRFLSIQIANGRPSLASTLAIERRRHAETWGDLPKE